MTDESTVYNDVRVKGHQKFAGIERQRVNHSGGEFVRGDAYESAPVITRKKKVKKGG